MVLCPVEPLSNQSTTFDLAWEPYKFIIKDGYFITKDVLVLKAKLQVFDHYFMPHPYSNLYNEEMLQLEAEIHDLTAQISHIEARRRKQSTILVCSIPIALLSAYMLGYIKGK